MSLLILRYKPLLNYLINDGEGVIDGVILFSENGIRMLLADLLG